MERRGGIVVRVVSTADDVAAGEVAALSPDERHVKGVDLSRGRLVEDANQLRTGAVVAVQVQGGESEYAGVTCTHDTPIVRWNDAA